MKRYCCQTCTPDDVSQELLASFPDYAQLAPKDLEKAFTLHASRWLAKQDTTGMGRTTATGRNMAVELQTMDDNHIIPLHSMREPEWCECEWCREGFAGKDNHHGVLPENRFCSDNCRERWRLAEKRRAEVQAVMEKLLQGKVRKAEFGMHGRMLNTCLTVVRKIGFVVEVNGDQYQLQG